MHIQTQKWQKNASAALSSYPLLENKLPEPSKDLAVLGLHGKVLVARGAADVAAVRSCQKLLPAGVTEAMPGSSKADTLWSRLSQ